jgi:hypothetical protein
LAETCQRELVRHILNYGYGVVDKINIVYMGLKQRAGALADGLVEIADCGVGMVKPGKVSAWRLNPAFQELLTRRTIYPIPFTE